MSQMKYTRYTPEEKERMINDFLLVLRTNTTVKSACFDAGIKEFQGYRILQEVGWVSMYLSPDEQKLIKTIRQHDNDAK